MVKTVGSLDDELSDRVLATINLVDVLFCHSGEC